MGTFISVEDSHVDVLHEISVRLGTSDGFHEVLNRVVDFASALVSHPKWNASVNERAMARKCPSR